MAMPDMTWDFLVVPRAVTALSTDEINFWIDLVEYSDTDEALHDLLQQVKMLYLMKCPNVKT
jgi:hypothetical protein